MPTRRKKSLTSQAAELAESVLPALEDAFESAKDAAGPLLHDVKEMASDAASIAKEKATEAAAASKDKAADAAAAGKEKVAEAAAATAAAAEAAKDSVPGVSGAEPEPKRGRRFLKRLLLVGGIAALAAFVAKKLRTEDAGDNWQSSYVPAPPPAPAPSEPAGDDAGGAGPDEALADAAEEPHPVTTPDAPAESVDVDPEGDKPAEA